MTDRDLGKIIYDELMRLEGRGSLWHVVSDEWQDRYRKAADAVRQAEWIMKPIEIEPAPEEPPVDPAIGVRHFAVRMAAKVTDGDKIDLGHAAEIAEFILNGTVPALSVLMSRGSKQ